VKLPTVSYNKTEINYHSINSFTPSEKKKNDENNKMRENIIGAIINKKIPVEYYAISNRWNVMSKNISEYVNRIVKQEIPDVNIDDIECIHKGGRKFNFDFVIKINNHIEFNIELKFNASKLDDTPQFVSPMKPSQYLSASYEEYYYNDYFLNLAKNYEMPIPSIQEYMNEIHSPEPKCMEKYQEKYYKGCEKSSRYTGDENDVKFYNDCKELSKESIAKFIDSADLLTDKLTEYLLQTQKNKFYMLVKNNNINLQCVDTKEYEIESYVKNPKNSTYLATTKTGKKMKILLRWKNGNGIAFPAFQIS
jgi:hypothetical protein